MKAFGFTLIELLVTLAILALLATMVLPLAELSSRREMESELRYSLRQIREALDAYKKAADEGRIALRPGESGYPKKLADLVEGIEDARSPIRARIHFLRRLPRDPFADGGLRAEETWGVRSYRSSHEYPMPGEDVFDVFPLSGGVGLNGIPYREW